jgi:hypothetical protein
VRKIILDSSGNHLIKTQKINKHFRDRLKRMKKLSIIEIGIKVQKLIANNLLTLRARILFKI